MRSSPIGRLTIAVSGVVLVGVMGTVRPVAAAEVVESEEGSVLVVNSVVVPFVGDVVVGAGVDVVVPAVSGVVRPEVVPAVGVVRALT